VAHSPLDLVEDLDADVGPPPGSASPGPSAPDPSPAGSGGPGSGGWRTPSWPEGTPGWVRSPLGALAVAVVTALVVGGAGVHQVRTQAQADLAHQRDLALVQVGAPVLAYDGSQTPADDSARVALQVDVSNAGTQPAGVSVLDLSTDHVELVEPSAPVELDAGESRTVALQAVVDCARVPEPSGAPAPTAPEPQWTEVAVEVAGERHVERRLVQATFAGQLDDMLRWACYPTWGSSSWADLSPQADGRLQVVVAGMGDVATTLGVDADPVLGLSSDVDLPVELPAGGSVTMNLALAPDCTGNAGGLGRDVTVTQQTAEDENSHNAISDSTVTAAWVARQVALACG